MSVLVHIEIDGYDMAKLENSYKFEKWSGVAVNIYIGEIYGKQTASKFVMYNVLNVSKNGITLQNIDNPLSLFETTVLKLQTSGYVRVSQTPYIDTQAATPKCRKAVRKPSRCPYTMDFLEQRADSQRPVAAVPDLFSEHPI